MRTVFCLSFLALSITLTGAANATSSPPSCAAIERELTRDFNEALRDVKNVTQNKVSASKLILFGGSLETIRSSEDLPIDVPTAIDSLPPLSSASIYSEPNTICTKPYSSAVCRQIGPYVGIGRWESSGLQVSNWVEDYSTAPETVYVNFSKDYVSGTLWVYDFDKVENWLNKTAREQNNAISFDVSYYVGYETLTPSNSIELEPFKSGLTVDIKGPDAEGIELETISPAIYESITFVSTNELIKKALLPKECR